MTELRHYLFDSAALIPAIVSRRFESFGTREKQISIEIIQVGIPAVSFKCGLVNFAGVLVFSPSIGASLLQRVRNILEYLLQEHLKNVVSVKSKNTQHLLDRKGSPRYLKNRTITEV